MEHHIKTKEEAWIDPPDLQYAKVRNERNRYRFTRNWFHNRNCATFSTFLKPKFDGTSPVRMVQIGVFEAMDLVWQFQNTLLHEDSQAVAIDPWLATNKLNQKKMSEVEGNARHNLYEWKHRCRIFKDFSQNVMIGLLGDPFWTGQLDYVIIDGDHDRIPVLADAILALQMVKKGGWLVFDDVRNQRPKKEHVVDGLRDFLSVFGDRVKQVWSHRFCECYERIR